MLNKVLLPELAEEHIHFLQRSEWTAEQKEWLTTFYFDEILPVLTPLTLDPSRPFPRTLNKSLNFIVRLNGRDAYGRQRHRAVVELMARFDEAENISSATRLQEAGAHVVYGLVGYKTHAKMSMVVRREPEGLIRYVHMGTGNYHPGTTRLYTDYSYMSSNQNLGEDVHKVFMQLTSLTAAENMVKVLTAPFELFNALIAKIDREIEFAKDGQKAVIVAKINSLIEPQIIDKLYEASSAGVQIDLIVRGICGLRPGIPGLSENIRVRSIIGRFLEHSRVYYFRNGGNAEFYCSRADWMDRKFFRRNETCFPIKQKPLKERLWKDLQLFLADNTGAWLLHGDGCYEQMTPDGSEPVSAQKSFLDELSQ